MNRDLATLFVPWHALGVVEMKRVFALSLLFLVGGSGWYNRFVDFGLGVFVGVTKDCVGLVGGKEREESEEGKEGKDHEIEVRGKRWELRAFVSD